MFIGYPSRRHEIPVKRLIPNLLTTIALCAGLASLHFSFKGDFDRAMACIGLAAVFDALDGRAARLLHATSSFGAVLDSLADFLSFGVAPAAVLYAWMLKDEDVLGLAAMMTFVLCSALRLARFTADAKSAKYGPPPGEPPPPPWSARFFVGLPTPAAAGAVLIPPMIWASRFTDSFRLHSYLVIAFVFVVSALMISRQPMFSFKKTRIRRGLVVPLMVLIGLVVVAAAKDPWLTAAGLAASYLLLLPVSITSFHRLGRAAALAESYGTSSGSDVSRGDPDEVRAPDPVRS